MKESEIMLKDVIDINTGRKLGYIDDVELDPDKGRIRAIIIPSSHYKLLRLFSREQDVVIRWDDIKTIGEDVILVDNS
ncbi:MAG: YlmC/YmxH family sporulation protein [Halanaerobiaceae bacterium]